MGGRASITNDPPVLRGSGANISRAFHFCVMPTRSESLKQATSKKLWRFLDRAKIFGDMRFFEVMFFKRPTQFFLARN